MRAVAFPRGEGQKVAQSGSNREGRQLVVATLLAKGGTVRAAAKQAGVAERTIRDWFQTETFRGMVRTVRKEYHARTMAMLADAGVRSVRKLVELRDHSPDERVQLAAAWKLIEASFRAYDASLVEERLAALEAAMAGAGEARAPETDFGGFGADEPGSGDDVDEGSRSGIPSEEGEPCGATCRG
jgi:hypothetical protein